MKIDWVSGWKIGIGEGLFLSLRTPPEVFSSVDAVSKAEF